MSRDNFTIYYRPAIVTKTGNLGNVYIVLQVSLYTTGTQSVSLKNIYFFYITHKQRDYGFQSFC